ncbi:dimethylsulfoniopropionate lyase [Roseovarius sp. SCSIO 43702]|uniref:dimethylsulfonioproprionate lyase family protein n=1 Tax=Roseovarius sp. SCSIO 43702 TaxID=2823043 RepID=UPI001C73D63F|nr:dimethylsulfonioproprionate lyase family protein [Roseovarius sp. SCSIO 43702]QYX58294.1 dimethylsulfoniopropionate lyase [Roseovarius sp. SCSIO 43702]
MNTQEKAEKLLDAAQVAYARHVEDPRAERSLERIFAAIDRPPAMRERPGTRLPVCGQLSEVPQGERFEEESLRELVAAFLALEPALAWYKRTGDTTNANAAYHEGHANAMIVGPGGLVPNERVSLGVSLLAPGVRYPDHTHPPEETYLVLSEGEFSQDGVTWFTPGIGGTFYNPPGILHAMRSGDTPLFAMWALWADA